jgi:hypothetical protein
VAGCTWGGQLVQLVLGSLTAFQCTFQQLQRNAGRSPTGLKAVSGMAEHEWSAADDPAKKLHKPVVVDHRYLSIRLGTRGNPIDAEADPTAARGPEAAALFDDERQCVFDLRGSVRVRAETGRDNLRCEPQYTCEDGPCDLGPRMGIPTMTFRRFVQKA